MHCVKRVAVAREEFQQLKKSYNNTRRSIIAQEKLEKSYNNTRRSIIAQEKQYNSKRMTTTLEEWKQHKKNESNAKKTCNNMRRVTQRQKSNMQSTDKSKNIAKPTTKNKTNNRRTLQDKKKNHEIIETGASFLYKILTLNNASTSLSSNYYLGTLNLKLID